MTTPIPMLDLQPQIDALFGEFQAAVSRVIRSGRFILGPEVEAFEQEAARFLSVEHAVGVASGADALTIGLRALGLEPGDEVITSPFTFFATGESIRHVGAVPVFADIEPDTFCLSPASVEARIGPRTRAILPVHLFGHPADTDALARIAHERRLLLFEDAAQAFGTRLGSQNAGAIGGAAAFSFFPSKNLGAFGDGGLLTTPDAEVDARARRLRNHGQIDRYRHAELGYTGRLDEIQAAVLRVKLRHLERWNDQRRAVAHEYTRHLKGVPGIVTPIEQPTARHVYHQYTLRILDDRRDALQKSLADAGVSSVIYYPVPLHQMPLFESKSGELPETDRAARQVLSLPIWPELEPDRVQRICELIDAIMRSSD